VEEGESIQVMRWKKQCTIHTLVYHTLLQQWTMHQQSRLEETRIVKAMQKAFVTAYLKQD
jgi:hypothetical protein